MSKLDGLSVEQEKLMVSVRQEWLDLVFKGKGFDEASAREGVEWLYSFCKLPKPKIVFVDSLLAAQFAANIVRAQVGAQVVDEVRAQVRAQVGDQVVDQVVDQVRAQVRVKKIKWFDFSYYANYSDTGWVAFYDFFERIGICKNENFIKFKKLIQTRIFETIQFKNLCIVVRPPVEINRLENRLHSSTGPAIKWQDSYENYFLHGVRFEKTLWENVLNGKLSAKEIISLKNVEQKQAVIKELGYEKIIAELDAKLINKDKYGELIEVDLQDDSSLARFVKVNCPSTDRIYLLRVSPSSQTCREGLAWMAYKKTEEYELQIET